MSETVTTEYDPNNPETWAVRDDVEGWNTGTCVYIQAPQEKVPGVTDNFIDAEADNLCVEVFAWGEVNVYTEGVDPRSMEQDVRREYTEETSAVSETDKPDSDYDEGYDTVPLSWITELLVDEGYIDKPEQYAAGEAVFPGQAEAVAMSIDTDEVTVPTKIKEAQWEAYREAVNQYTSMNTMDDLDERTARVKFENWYEMNYSTE